MTQTTRKYTLTEAGREARRKSGVARSVTPAQRFWLRVDKTSSCWLWTGCLDIAGYGRFRSGGKKEPTVLAHRFSWSLTNGPITNSLNVCHKCDVPACVNPDHLFIGTHADNTSDKIKKGRHMFGEKHTNARLTEAQARSILLDTREPMAIAPAFGITVAHVYSIRSRRIWKCL